MSEQLTDGETAAETTESDEQASETGASRPSKVQRLEHEGDIAADYLEELLDIADLDGDLDMDVEGDRASVQIGGADLSQLVGRNGEVLEALQELTRLAVYRETGERSRLMLDIADLDGDLDMDVEGDRASVQIGGADLSQLVGRNGEVLEALQELTRLAVYRETGERSRLMLDIDGHRAQQRERLVALAETSIAEVKESGESVSLDPMSAFERKVVHDAVAAAGLTSESEGAEPKRHVVIIPA